MVRKYKRRVRRRRRKGSTLKKKVLAIVNKQSEKKSNKVDLDWVEIPIYITTPPDIASAPWIAMDLISLENGNTLITREGAKTTGLMIDFRSIFRFHTDVPASVSTFVNIFIIHFPQKITRASPGDMRYILENIDTNAGSTDWESVYNSAYQNNSLQSYNVLYRRNFTMTKDTTNSMKIVNRKIRLKGKMRHQDFGRLITNFSSPPIQGSVCVYASCSPYLDNNTPETPLDFSCNARYYFVDN